MGWRQTVTRRIPRRMVLAFARRYVAGASLESGLEHADALWRDRRLRSTLDVLGESIHDEALSRHALALYQQAAHAAAGRPWVSLSIKPGHFGHYVRPGLAEPQIAALAETCQAQGTRLTIDMEDLDLTDETLRLYRALKPRFPVLGTVLQARLFRTEHDLEALAGLDARVRLCLGVYEVPPDVGHTRKPAAKRNLLRLLPRLLDVAGVVELATHDEQVIAEARELFARRGIDRSRVEFQMLLGVPRRRLQDELVAEGWSVRLYVPFADSWNDAVAYLRRRLAESPSLALLVVRNLLAGDAARAAPPERP